MIELKSTVICTKKCFICFNKSPSKKIMKHTFYFTLKVLFLLETCKFLSWYFGHIGKTTWLENFGWFQNLWHHNLVNRQLQYTYFLIYHKVNETRQWSLVSYSNITREKLSFKYHAKYDTGRLVPDLSFLYKSFKWGKSKWFAA